MASLFEMLSSRLTQCQPAGRHNPVTLAINIHLESESR